MAILGKHSVHLPVIVTLISATVGAIWWAKDVSGYGERIKTLETTSANQTTSLAVITNEVHDTKDQVHDIWQAMHLDRLKK